MMEELLEVIENSDYIETGLPAKSTQIATYVLGMEQEGFVALPDEYIEFVSSCNGLIADGIRVFGVDPAEDFIDDILTKNDDWGQAQGTTQLLIGEDEYNALIFDGAENIYFILDKDLNKIDKKFDELPQALAYLLKF